MKPPTNDIIPQGYKMTELGALPEEWEVVKLDNEYIEFKNGLWKGKKGPYIKVKILRNTNFNNDGTISFKDVAELNVEEKSFKDREIIKGDIILERSGGGPTQPVGRVVFFEKSDKFRYSFSNFTSRIRVTNELKIFPKFLFYFLFYFYYQGKTNDIQNRTTGIRNLDFSKYKQIPIPLPPLPEQQKIAAVLSAVQEAKEKTEAVIAATKALKKSMMKHLFTYGPVSPQEAENVPLKETEIGPVPEDWEVVKLDNEYIEFKNGLWKGKKGPYIKVKVLRNTNFNNDGTINFKDVAELNVEEKSFKDREIIKGDIILERSGGGPTQPVGRVVFFEKSDKFRYSFSNFTSRIRVTNELKIFPKFLFYFLFYFYYQGKTNDIQNRTTGIRNLDFSKYKQIPIPLPPLAIQQKIASILSAIDANIEAEENKKKALEELFKSLLHNLMTANIRVNQLEVTS